MRESNILPKCYKSLCLVIVDKFYALSIIHMYMHIYICVYMNIHIYILKPIIYFLLPVGNDSAKNRKKLTETENKWNSYNILKMYVCMKLENFSKTNCTI